MRKLMVVIAVVAQVMVLAAMVYGRESVVQNGERVLLRTAPIDPRDPFRGDFVRLQYPMNRPDGIPLHWSPSDYKPSRGDRVYAVLSQSLGTVHEVDYITNVKPDSGKFIRGRIASRFHSLINLNFNNNQPPVLNIKYGIEQMFVEQGAGLDIEKIQGVRGGLQVPMEVEVALGADGVAVLTGHQWSPIGMEMIFVPVVANQAENVVTSNSPENDDLAIDQQSDGLIVPQVETEDQPDTLSIRIVNTSDDSITLNNPGNDCAFTIKPADLHNQVVQAISSGCSQDLEPKALTLASGESYTIGVNLADQRWFVESQTQVATDLRLIDIAMYRIVYRTPANTPKDDQDDFWMGEISSQAFNGRGRVD